ELHLPPNARPLAPVIRLTRGWVGRLVISPNRRRCRFTVTGHARQLKATPGPADLVVTFPYDVGGERREAVTATRGQFYAGGALSVGPQVLPRAQQVPYGISGGLTGMAAPVVINTDHRIAVVGDYADTVAAPLGQPLQLYAASSDPRRIRLLRFIRGTTSWGTV